MRRPVPDTPKPGQESAWDYPRPPRVELTDERVEVFLGGRCIASTQTAKRVLETSHAPVYYLPVAAFVDGALRPVPGTTWCEYKGRATYFDLVSDGQVASRAGWTYPEPSPDYTELRDHVAVYPQRVDRCEVDGEVVGDVGSSFYAGWVTSRVAGPFKGAPGTEWW